jgi:hypothetical protein
LISQILPNPYKVLFVTHLYKMHACCSGGNKIINGTAAVIRLNIHTTTAVIRAKPNHQGNMHVEASYCTHRRGGPGGRGGGDTIVGAG